MEKCIGIFNSEWQLVTTISPSSLCHCEESSTKQSHSPTNLNTDCHVAEPPRNDMEGVLVVADLVEHSYSQIIASVLEKLKTENPQLNVPVKDEDGCVVDMLRVGPDDERYMDGVANELKRPGLQAYVLDCELMDILKKVNESTVSLRVQVVPEVLSLDAEHATIALEAII